MRYLAGFMLLVVVGCGEAQTDALEGEVRQSTSALYSAKAPTGHGVVLDLIEILRVDDDDYCSRVWLMPMEEESRFEIDVDARLVCPWQVGFATYQANPGECDVPVDERNFDEGLGKIRFKPARIPASACIKEACVIDQIELEFAAIDEDGTRVIQHWNASDIVVENCDL